MSTTETGHWKKTACILCAVNCGLEVQTSGERIVRIRGDKANPVSEGYLCEKSQRMDYYQNGADRIDSPMRRRADGSYVRIDWTTAIGEIAARLKSIRDQHGGDSILYYGGGSQGNHLGATYADNALKAHWVDVPSGKGHVHSRKWPGESLREWHERHGLLA